MTASDVLKLLAMLERASLPAWVIGGWGVDALVGRTTREHADLDLFIRAADESRAIAVLESDGFRLERDGRPSHFGMRHSDGREVDLHLIEPFDDGGALWRRQDGDVRVRLPANWATSGVIDGVTVACASAVIQRELHTGYALDSVGASDLLLLEDR